MSEYIIEWSGIGARITELMGSETPCIAIKHLRKERIREKIVRCRDCKCASVDELGNGWCNENCREIKTWDFCAWGERKEKGKGNDGEQ